MSRPFPGRKVRRRTRLWVSVAGSVLIGNAIPSEAFASLVINLQVGNGATKQFLNPTKNGTDVPVYVYATVSGANAVTPVPPANLGATSGNFHGVQYLFYNVLNSGSQPITGLVGNGTVGQLPQLNATLGFGANGSQAGKVQNIAGGISIGSSNNLDDIAFPRASSAVWDNASSGGTWLGSDGQQIVLSNANTTVSFLVETFYFHPTGYSQANNTTFTVSVPNLLATTGFTGSGANWFQDNTVKSSPPQSLQSGPYSAGTSVTFTDTLLGDTNDNGMVDVIDLGNLATNYGATSGKTWVQGDFDLNGTVDVIDLGNMATNYGSSLSGAPTSAPGSSEAQAMSANSLAIVEAHSSAVPEPASVSVLGLTGLALVRRRPRIAR